MPCVDVSGSREVFEAADPQKQRGMYLHHRVTIARCGDVLPEMVPKEEGSNAPPGPSRRSRAARSVHDRQRRAAAAAAAASGGNAQVAYVAPDSKRGRRKARRPQNAMPGKWVRLQQQSE